MKTVFKDKFLLLVLFAFILLFLPSFFTFFTHDDFFHLVISVPKGLVNFISYFDITKPQHGYAHFRPLTTQVFYSLAWVFNLNPLYMHMVLFINYCAVIYLVYKFFKLLGLSEFFSRIGTFLYVVSSTHFGRLYFLSTQEYGYTLFTLLSLIFYIEEYKSNKVKYFWFSIIFYVFALLSKETAVITPLLIMLSMVYFEMIKTKKGIYFSMKNYLFRNIKKLGLFVVLTGVYLYFRVNLYGIATGDSYIWEFSPRVLNTAFWYGLWSFNIPEMLVDFIGPGLHVNPNLFTYWSKEIIPIGILFSVQIIILFRVLVKNYNDIKKLSVPLVFGIVWFVVSLIPYLFLPLHKFSFYTTVSLIGVVLFIAYFLTSASRTTLLIFCVLWFATSFFTLKLTKETHWITSGAQTAKRVDEFLRSNKGNISKYSIIAFVDTEKDNTLPWKPSEVVKTSLSDQNYFKVFYPDITACYGENFYSDDVYKIEARQFVGY